MLTCGGYIKKTELAAFSNIRANGLIAISLEEGDQLRWVRRARVEDSIIIGSRYGMAIHFRTDHDQLRPLGRATRGVRAMKLRDGDELVQDKLAALHIVNEDDELMMVTSRGIIIRQAVNAISPQSRAATGVRVQRLDEDDAIAAVALVPPNDSEQEESE